MNITRPNIHILGAGSVGTFITHCLESTSSPPHITLIIRPPNTHGPSPLIPSSYTINLTHGTSSNTISSPSHTIPTLAPPLPKSRPPLTNLIVTTKAHQTLPALRPLLPFLSTSTSILFLQNGMGVVDEVRHEITSHLGSTNLPNMLSGVVVHGIRQVPSSRKELVHLDVTDSLGYVEIGYDDVPGSKRPQVLQALLGAPLLGAKTIPGKSFREKQLLKLVSNAVINPLTALYGVRNGELLKECYEVEVDVIVGEISMVFQKLAVADGDAEGEKYTAAALKKEVMRVATVTGGNMSSMLADVQATRKTEIEYINGWIVKKGKELGIDCPKNAEIMERVKNLEGIKKLSH
ncbi:hypothetical protein EX30DRAFT_360671 [Ascodesmis nigricans]|uniref:2-dehydropantoate 2-reductase n=1 Tax=Ascodesmis nigricans TaxID=341454 RepID=A0A4S2N6E0_9PEZI|nr:hypothetical protein EX30DRAFT_360671 [Ascodesmis nigricans]